MNPDAGQGYNRGGYLAQIGLSSDIVVVVAAVVVVLVVVVTGLAD